MLKSISCIAGVAGMTAVALASPNPLPLHGTTTSESIVQEVPADYASLVSDDAVAVVWIGDLESFLKSVVKTLMPNPGAIANTNYSPPPIPIPPSFNSILEGVIHSDITIPTSTPILAWLTFDKTPDGQGTDTPNPYFAMKVSGANEQNTKAMSDTTVFFDGDMVIFTQGNNVKWSKPAKSSTQLIDRLPKQKPVAVAADIAKIWKGQGSQIQMMGGLAAMAAQGTLMQPMQGETPEQQKSMRTAQQKISQMMRSGMDELFGQIAKMTFMTMSIDMEDPSSEMQMDFQFKDDLGLDQGVESSLISDLPDGMMLYAGLNAKFAQCLLGLDMGLMDAIMVGLDKTQSSELDAVMQRATELNKSITGGLTMALDINSSGTSKWTEISVQNAADFISGFGQISKQFSNVDMGIDMKETGKDQWSMKIDDKKLGESVNNAIMGQHLSTEWGTDLNLTMTSKGNNVVVAKVLPPDGSFPSGNNSKLRTLLNPPAGHALVGAISLDLPALFSMIIELENPNRKPPRKELQQIFGNHPLLIRGSAKENSMRIDISGLQLALTLPAMARAREMARERGDLNRN